jgi:hypothetical protein
VNVTRATIILRGEEVEVEYRDHGYEPDTNAHEIDWWFADPNFNPGDLSDVEEIAIYEALALRSLDCDD